MRLGDISPGLKCRNAGASWISIDLPFDDPEHFELAAAQLTPERIAPLYGLAPDEVRIYPYRPATAIKITLPRPTWNGGIEETDFDGAQQFAPLLDLTVEPGR
ncbi:DUF4387 family protein [Rhizorhabdus dicambivorans]|uniref:DUF4387 family protein n=1 Tax=Rhizorhabdus dicambivorans TaxID=1850238 RepID=UPI001596CF18|nr:DUF4387 family protein [Rhizorhabdus dicambivorans]